MIEDLQVSQNIVIKGGKEKIINYDFEDESIIEIIDKLFYF